MNLFRQPQLFKSQSFSLPSVSPLKHSYFLRGANTSACNYSNHHHTKMFKRKPRMKKQVLFQPLSIILKQHKKTITRAGFLLYTDSSSSASVRANANVNLNASLSSNANLNEKDSDDSKKTNESKKPEREFLFGVDFQSQDLTDFAGRFKKCLDGDIVDTAIRELKEETLGVFDTILNVSELKQNVLKTAWAITDFQTLIIFWKLPVLDETIVQARFLDLFKEQKRPEISRLSWVPSSVVLKCLDDSKNLEGPSKPNQPQIYFRIRKLLKLMSQFITSLS